MGTQLVGLGATTLIVSFGCTARAAPEVPVLGRWQDFSYSAPAVERAARTEYDGHTATLRRQGCLDGDRAILRRVLRIAGLLIREAIALKPQAAHWRWEIHTTSSPDELASDTARGKPLFGSRYIRDLALTNGELATLIAHEIAHAIAEHQREMLSKIADLNPATLPLSVPTAMAHWDSSWSYRLNFRAFPGSRRVRPTS